MRDLRRGVAAYVDYVTRCSSLLFNGVAAVSIVGVFRPNSGVSADALWRSCDDASKIAEWLVTTPLRDIDLRVDATYFLPLH